MGTIHRKDITSHTGIDQPIGPALSHRLLGSNHQQIRVRPAIPVAPGTGAKQPDLIRQTTIGRGLLHKL